MHDRAYLTDPEVSEADRLASIIIANEHRTGGHYRWPDGKTRDQDRVDMCAEDPLLFAVTYFPHHLASPETGGIITFNDLHLDLVEHATQWPEARANPEPRGYRQAYIAPREAGKSTWCYLILPMWAAAYNIFRFIAAFADSPTQATDHLKNFRHELDHNVHLRADFPELCRPALRQVGALQDAALVTRQVASYSMRDIETASGFRMSARGINTPALGLKAHEKRPDCLILDDVEKGEENYTENAVAKRLKTLEDVIFPLSEYAQVVITGTVTRFGSIIHQLVLSVTSPDIAEEWIAEQRITAHYYPAIVTEADGTRRSIWPAKWTMAYLVAHEHERAFAKNMMNLPRSELGLWWTESDIRQWRTLFSSPHRPGFIATILSVDGAVTARTGKEAGKRSDYTGMTVASLFRDRSDTAYPYKAVFRAALALRVPHDKFRVAVLDMLQDFPEATEIVVETNQGGDLWLTILHGMPVPVTTLHQHIPKEVRIEHLLNGYQRGLVYHDGDLPHLTNQELAYPNVVNDDVVDSAATAVRHLFARVRARQTSRGRQGSYING